MRATMQRGGLAAVILGTILGASARADITISATTVGGVPGSKVQVQADLGHGTIQQIKNQDIVFTIDGKTTLYGKTNSSGHAQAEFVIPKTAKKTIPYTAALGRKTAKADINIRK